MRTRDRPLLLERALESVFAQTLTDYVLVVVNDGGDAAAVERLVQGRAEIIHHPAPLGMQAASNAGIRGSRSEYVVIHDDDDTWDPRFLELTSRHLEETGAMGVIATTDKVVERIVDGRIEVVETARLHPELRFVNLYAMCFENYATPISFLYRRQVYETIGLYDEELDSAGDWDFGLRFLLHWEIEFLPTPEALAFYRHRPEGADANSVYTDRHRRAENLVANRYLRRDLEAGRTGLGLIVNTLRYQHERERVLLEESRRAGHERAEHLAGRLWELEEHLRELDRSLTPAARTRSYLRFLGSLPSRIARRE